MAFQLVGAASAVAQRATLGAVFATTSHDLLNGPIGPAFSLATPIGRRVDLSLMVERLESTTDGTGVVCGGLINPDRCPVEPFQQKGRLSLVSIGAAVHLASTRIVSVSVQPQFLWGRAQTETNGATTGNRLFSEKGQFGFSGGLEVGLFPAPRLPLGVVLGGTFGRLGPIHSDLLLDGYTPFDDWYTVRSAYVGLALQWRRGRL
jgi:hypothetical protein